MPTLLRRTVRLHREQARFRRSDALYRGFVGGRGAGKSWVGAYDLIRRAKRGRTYLVGSPTGVLLQDTTFPTFKAIAQDLGVWDPSGVKMTPYPSVRLSTGATVRFRTAEDPERMRGPNLSGVWLDEASLMEREAFTICIAALREAGEQGWLSATFTPKGLSHWTYEVFGKQTPDTAIFHARTRDNPFNPAGFHDTLVGQYADARAKQELDGLFVSLEGAEWPDYFPDSIWFSDWPVSPVVSVLACDPSLGGGEKKRGCYAAIVYCALDSRGVLWCEAWMSQGWDGGQLAEKIVEKAEQFRPTSVLFEANGGQAFLGFLLHAGARDRGFGLPLDSVTHSEKKEDRIRAALTWRLKRGELRFRDTPQTRLLVNQAREFPVGEFVDGPDALAMGCDHVARLLGKRKKGKA